MDKKRINLLLLLACVTLCLAFVVVTIFVESNKSTDFPPLQYVLDTNALLPDEPGYSDEYIYSQIPSESWTPTQIDEWFIRPEGQNLDQLKTANDQVIRKILEVAP